MAYKIIEDYLPSSDNRNYGSRGYNPKYIIVHNTANKASARSESKYMDSKQSEVTCHEFIDDKEIIKKLPHSMTCWCAGDGRYGKGNRDGINLEICYSTDYKTDKYYKAEDNASRRVAELMKAYNIPIQNVLWHRDCSGKYCPHRIFNEKREKKFKDKVLKYFKGNVGSASNRISTKDFIAKIKDSAIKGWQTHKILPSLTLAQAILESDSGNSELAVNANALFGIKAHTEPKWPNKYKKLTTEWVDGKKVQTYAEFKAYTSWGESLRDRYKYLVTRNINGKYIYKDLIGIADYKKAAQEIYRAGYATDPKYPQKLIGLIEKYKLYEYDKEALKEQKEQNGMKAFVFINDGDLGNSFSVLSNLPDAVIAKTADATKLKNLGFEVIQIGGKTIPGADKVLMGQDRAETQKAISEYVLKQRGDK